VRVATGFRPGGPNIVPPGAPAEVASYDSDELTSYEAGLKTETGNGLFALDVAAFFLDWEDIQLFAVVEGFGVNANGGTAESRGLEFTASLLPADGLTLSLNGAYTDAELTEDTSDQVGGLDGDPLPFVPEWSFGLSTSYDWQFSGDAEAYVGATLGYTGERPIAFDQRAADGSIQEADGYTTVDLRAGLRYERWSFELYGENLSNEEGITSVGTANTIATGMVDLGLIRPRTFGLSAGFEF
jgi:outer membrane receptor protein involved in Fe transport